MGIPRALHYYSFHPFWRAYFESLGLTVVVSQPTTRRILDEGIREAVSEACIPVKVHHGHVRELAGPVDYSKTWVTRSYPPSALAGRCAVFAESDMIHKQQRAFEEALGFEIVVPGYYGVMGALGVVVVAREATEGKKTRFRGFSAADMVFAPVSLECSGCPNHCEIVQINGDGRPLARWGGRCERWERLSA